MRMCRLILKKIVKVRLHIDLRKSPAGSVFSERCSVARRFYSILHTYAPMMELFEYRYVEPASFDSMGQRFFSHRNKNIRLDRIQPTRATAAAAI